MTSDIDKIIELIDQKIKSLNQAKRILVEEFGANRELTLPGIKTKSHETYKMTSKQKIAKLLQEAGPQTRGEIVAKTGVKLGTISFALNDKKLFFNKEGKWFLKESKVDAT